MAQRHALGLGPGQRGVDAPQPLAALNCSALLQALTGTDTAGRAHGKRLRRELIGVPGRVVRHAGRLIVRVAPRYAYLGQARHRLAALPVPAG